jgi:hypothetical protein
MIPIILKYKWLEYILVIVTDILKAFDKISRYSVYTNSLNYGQFNY